jgi:hypothetical protein
MNIDKTRGVRKNGFQQTRRMSRRVYNQMCKMQTDEPGSKQETRLRCAWNATSSVNFIYFLEKLRFVVFLCGRLRAAITTARPVGSPSLCSSGSRCQNSSTTCCEIIHFTYKAGNSESKVTPWTITKLPCGFRGSLISLGQGKHGQYRALDLSIEEWIMVR